MKTHRPEHSLALRLQQNREKNEQAMRKQFIVRKRNQTMQCGGITRHKAHLPPNPPWCQMENVFKAATPGLRCGSSSWHSNQHLPETTKTTGTPRTFLHPVPREPQKWLNVINLSLTCIYIEYSNTFYAVVWLIAKSNVSIDRPKP